MSRSPIELWYCSSPNGHKVTIMLEELGLEYRVHYVDIHAGDQLTPEFLKLNPNNKIPVIVDPDGPGGRPIVLSESGAILLYLAEKAGGRFVPEDPVRRHTMMQWLMWQMSGLGPMVGQMAHFILYAKGPARQQLKDDAAIEYPLTRYSREVARLYNVLESRLRDHEYLVDEYSVADIACTPLCYNMVERYPEKAAEYPNVWRWNKQIQQRPAVQRGLVVMKNRERPESYLKKPVSDEVWDNLFGERQHQRR